MDIVTAATNTSDLVLPLFWIAITAAMFSTADSQAYSIVLLSSFSVERGESNVQFLSDKSPLALAAIAAIIFSLIFLATHLTMIPFEQIVFFVLPFFLCTTPVIVQLSLKEKIDSTYVILSVIGYTGFGILMIVIPKYGFFWSLAAPLVPGVICGYIYARSKFFRSKADSALTK